jgi:Flp pilus assembly protein TadG
MASMIFRRKRRPGERGAALVEFALVLPLLLVVIAGIVDFAFLFQRYEVITNAAREGARLASLSAPFTYSDAQVNTRVRDYIKAGLNMTDLTPVQPTSGQLVTVTAVTLDVDAGEATVAVPARQVTVTYRHTFLLLGPMLALINGSWGTNMNLVATSQMRMEVPAAEE